jgi:hypothetical protein
MLCKPNFINDKAPPLLPILSQINSVHAITFYFCTFYFNAISNYPQVLQGILYFRYRHKGLHLFTCFLCELHAPPISCPKRQKSSGPLTISRKIIRIKLEDIYVEF